MKILCDFEQGGGDGQMVPRPKPNMQAASSAANTANTTNTITNTNTNDKVKQLQRCIGTILIAKAPPHSAERKLVGLRSVRQAHTTKVCRSTSWHLQCLSCWSSLSH
jgi:hypothetical protein